MADNQMTALIYEEGLEKLRGRRIASFGGRTAATPDEWGEVARASGFDPEGDAFYDPAAFDGIPEDDESRLSLGDKMALRLQLEVMDLPEVKAAIEDLKTEVDELAAARDEAVEELAGYREAVGEELQRFLGSLVDDGIAVDFDANEFPILDRALNAIAEVVPEDDGVVESAVSGGGEPVAGAVDQGAVAAESETKPKRKSRGKKEAAAEVAS